jgi:hypothetical protein
METSTLFLIVLFIIIIFFFSSMKITFSTSNNNNNINNNTKDYTKSEPASATQKNNTLVDSPSLAVSLANIQRKFY